MRRTAIWLSLAIALSGCASEPSPEPGLVASAEFGIFYGGQVQERDELPFSLDRGVQRQGIRIDFRAPLDRPVRVSWELDMPGTTRKVRDTRGRRGRGRVVKSGQAEARAGQERVEIELPFSPGDPLGTWNLRVQVEDQVVIDRPFLVYDPDTRPTRRRDRLADRDPRVR